MTSLDLSHNNLTNFKNQKLNLFPFLEKLNLSSCSLTEISESSFKNLTRLTILDLSNNKLESVPSAELASLTMLQKLVLSGNMFSSLGPHSFRELHKLQQLYLTNCSRLRYNPDFLFINNNVCLPVRSRWPPSTTTSTWEWWTCRTTSSWRIFSLTPSQESSLWASCPWPGLGCRPSPLRVSPGRDSLTSTSLTSL